MKGFSKGKWSAKLATTLSENVRAKNQKRSSFASSVHAQVRATYMSLSRNIHQFAACFKPLSPHDVVKNHDLFLLLNNPQENSCTLLIKPLAVS